MTAFRASILIALVLNMLAAQGIRAQQPLTGGVAQKQSQNVWKSMDYCKREAWKQNQDYTAEGAAARDRVVRHCLEAGNFPPASPESPVDHRGLPTAKP